MPINSRFSLRIMDFYATGITAMASRMSHFAFILMVISGHVLGFLDSRQMGNGLNRRDRGYAAIQSTGYIDDYMEDYLDKNHYTGAALGVARGNMLVYSKGYGTSVKGTAMEPSTLLPVSSISKTITAVAILRLVQDGKLSLADRVFGGGGLLQSLKPWKGASDHRLHKITVEHLLHHTAGWSQQKPPLYDPLMNEVYLARGHNVLNISREMDLIGELKQRDVIQFMMGRKLDHAPGTTYEYSNLGYSILGQVIEEVSWMSYEDYVREYVFEPLGMWQTRLKPPGESDPTENIYSIAFQDGEVPFMGYPNAKSPSISLIDSSLGWYSTVYDIMRFVTGLADGTLLTRDSYQYLLIPPSSPMFEHQETWPGMGVRVSNTGAWWQVADPHDNEIIIFHQATSMALTKPKDADVDSMSWVLIMSSNNRKNLRLFDEIFSSINWPFRNLFLEDCGLSTQDTANDPQAVLLQSKISEHRFPTYLNALSRSSIYPTWINTYNFNSETFMSVVSTHQPNNAKPAAVSGLLISELKSKADELSSQGLQLSFINSYSSSDHQGHIMQAAIFTSSTERTLLSGFHKSYEHYLHSLDRHREQGYLPVVQSISSRHGTPTVSFIFEKRGSANWNSYTNLTLQQLDGVVRSNALLDRTLHYLDSYNHEGTLFFSAIFLDEGLHTWHFQATVSEFEFQDAAKTYTRLGYHSSVITGYEHNNELNFAVLWVKK
eukprot:XP_003729375.1 PREDICTED: uncharacterized protein LOC100891431 [Strongylocentrotus purpuratus]